VSRPIARIVTLGGSSLRITMRFPVPFAALTPLKHSAWAKSFAALRGSADGPAGKQWRRAGNL